MQAAATMSGTIPRTTLLDVLLNTLEAERYVRRPLLRDVIELLADEGFVSAAAVASDMLARMDAARLEGSAFALAMADLRGAVKKASPASGPPQSEPVAANAA
jgi:hypothetical protein